MLVCICIYVRSLGWKDSLEKDMATLSSILPWRIPWTEEPGGLQFIGSQRVGTGLKWPCTHPASRLWWLKAPIPLGDLLRLQVQVSDFWQLRTGGLGRCFLNIPASPFSEQKPQSIFDRCLLVSALPQLSQGNCSATEATGTLGRRFLGSSYVSELLTRSSQVFGEVLWENADVWEQACSAVGILALLTWLSPQADVKSCDEFIHFHCIIIITLASSLVDSSLSCSFARAKLSCGSYIFCRGFATVGN